MEEELFERMRLITELKKMYPYPSTWYEKLSTPQLIAIYNRPAKRPKRIEQVQIPEDYTQSEVRKIINGERMIRTESGTWEREID